MINKISRFFIRCGLILILAAAGLVGYNYWDSARAEKASNEVIEAMQDMQVATDDEDASDEENVDAEESPELFELYPDMEMPTVEINGYRYVGILEIPVWDRRLPVMEECDETRLKIAVCRYSGSVYKDNMVIAGHNYRRHLSHIQALPEGTEINFIDVDGNVFHYEIAWVEVVNPTDITGMTGILTENDGTQTETESGEEWDLTLFTCTMGGTDRYAVRCVQIDE